MWKDGPAHELHCHRAIESLTAEDVLQRNTRAHIGAAGECEAAPRRYEAGGCTGPADSRQIPDGSRSPTQ